VTGTLIEGQWRRSVTMWDSDRRLAMRRNLRSRPS
jgi:hypothetical protein